MSLIKPDLSKPVFQIMPEKAELIKAGRCPTCEQPIHENAFTTELEIREFSISGMCPQCQKKIFTDAFDYEREIPAAIDNLIAECGMNGKDEFISYDIDEFETEFKTMSDAGKRDLEFAQKIEKIFNDKGIIFEHGLQPRVFCVRNSQLIKMKKNG